MLENNISLKRYNTFGISVNAAQFLRLNTPQDLIDFNKPIDPTNTFILGGGSNVLFISNTDKLIIHPTFKGIDIVDENASSVLVKAMAGEEWDDLVQWAVDHNFGGIENLSNIPGNVGACPVQNIGAYGVEVKDVIEKVHAIELTSKEQHTFNNEECKFSYRDSIFKCALKGKFLITEVFFRLQKTPQFLLNYGDVKKVVEELGGASLQNIRKAICTIRASKLPETTEFGNAGSFFKNPVIDKTLFLDLQDKHPDIKFFEIEKDQYKIPAAWLIDQCKLKGYTLNNAAVHRNQPLVIINLGHADGNNILQLANKVIETVKQSFNITLHPEVNII